MGATLPLCAWKQIAEFIDPLADPLYHVVNEMVLGYLQHTVIPHMGNRGVSAAAELLFPQPTLQKKGRQLDVWCHRHFRQPDALPIPNVDSAYVGSRIASFLSRFTDSPVMFGNECVAGITRAVAYMPTEVLERANRRVRDSERTRIMPSDVRMTVYYNPRLPDCFQFLRVSWEGRVGSGSPE